MKKTTQKSIMNYKKELVNFVNSKPSSKDFDKRLEFLASYIYYIETLCEMNEITKATATYLIVHSPDVSTSLYQLRKERLEFIDNYKNKIVIQKEVDNV